MIFRDWLKKNTVRDDAVGDFARDVGMDLRFPTADSKERIQSYLQINGACTLALDAFNAAWTECKK